MITNSVLKNSDFSKKIIGWYKKNKRELPWRSVKNPYYIWLSEVILQQTRVAQGLPYYEKFVTTYPTIQDLAKADEHEVLRLWQGLGYYSRARNMHKTAQLIIEKYDGIFPNTYQELLKLKGIGPYTAAAIASFAFDEAVPVVDGNVFRVLARFWGIKQDIAAASARKIFTEVAEELIPNDNAAEFNQAIMELGALQCTPHSPDCSVCPLLPGCYAYEFNQQAELPIKLKKTKVRHRYLHYLVLDTPDGIYLKKRGSNDIWEGLYDFYLEETMHPLHSIEELSSEWLAVHSAKIVSIQLLKKTKHVLTHQVIHADFWHIKLKSSDFSVFNSTDFYTKQQIRQLPKPILIANFFEEFADFF